MDDFQTKPITNFLHAVRTTSESAPTGAEGGAVKSETKPADTTKSDDAPEAADKDAAPSDETAAAPGDDLDLDDLTSDGVPLGDTADGNDDDDGSDGDDDGEEEDEDADDLDDGDSDDDDEDVADDDDDEDDDELNEADKSVTDIDKAPSADLSVSDNKVRVVLKVLRSVEQQVHNAIRLLEDGKPDAATIALTGIAPSPTPSAGDAPHSSEPIDGRIVEGVFDGQAMVGSDGKTYSVPPNYASKSKLVEGDMLKLTITPKGSFIYKQIGPIDRSRLIGSLGYDDTIGQYYAASDDKRWNVLRASVTYFKGEPGDEVVLLIPKNAPSKWAAVENIIKSNPLE